MKHNKFLPDVARNRVLSNWVLASFGSSPSDSKRFKLAILLLTILLSLTIGYFGLSTRNSNLERVMGHSATKAVTSRDSGDLPSIKGCSEQNLRDNLADYAPVRDAVKSISGYKTLPSQDLGGELVIDFVCKKTKSQDAYRTFWILFNKKWNLNEISRPPSR